VGCTKRPTHSKGHGPVPSVSQVLSLDLSKAQAKPKLLPCKTPSPIHGHTATALGQGRILVLGGSIEDWGHAEVSATSCCAVTFPLRHPAHRPHSRPPTELDYHVRGGRRTTSWLARCGSWT
jgi:hypothetical protein